MYIRSIYNYISPYILKAFAKYITMRNYIPPIMSEYCILFLILIICYYYMPFIIIISNTN